MGVEIFRFFKEEAEILTPTIQEFPAGERIWRVDFLGGLERNPAIPDEPTVQVIISPLRDSSLRDSDKLASVNAVIDDKRKVIRIGVGQLPYLKIGSLWQKGRLLQYSAGTERVYNITIDKTQRLFMAHRLVDGGQLIPPLCHKIGVKGGKAFCVTLEYDGDPQGIIIPAIEVLRFYYAVSTPLARAIFMGDFFQNLNAIIDPHHCADNFEASILVLKLRRVIHDIEGWLIGRMLYAPEARQCLKNLRASMVSQSTKGHTALYLPAKFPFSGSTHLTVRGKPIQADDGRWRFLVFSLERCTAPFPFERLIVDREFANPYLEGVSFDDPELNWLPAHMRKKPVMPSDKPIIQSKREPAKDCAPTIFPASADAFPFLQGKKVEKLGREEIIQLFQSIGSESQSVFTEMFSTGGGGYASDNTIAPAEIQPRQRRKGLPADMEIFRELLKELNKLGAEASLREPSDATSCIPTPGPGTWRYLDRSLRTPREVGIGDVLLRNRWWCLVEFQQRANDSCNMGILTQPDGDIVDDAAIASILRGLANVRGVWKNIKPAYKPGIFMKYIKHSSATPAEFARAVVQKIMF